MKNMNYNEEMQELFLRFMVSDNDIIARVNSIVQPYMFDRQFRNAITFIKEHVQEYNSMPTIEQIEASADIKLEKVEDFNARHVEWFMDEFETFCRHKALEKAITNAKYVINLAHGGASGSFEAIRDAMVGSAELVGRLCLEHNIERLVHVGSIASLFLGDKNQTIHADEPSDPQPESRADYSHAKILADEALLKMHREQELPLVVLRPGVVVGENGMINHTGIGFFNNTQHFIGWNNGKNPLPFVLVEDTASAIVQSIDSDVVGKSLNIVGDVRIGAKEYIAELSKRVKRPYKYHAQPTWFLYAQEVLKWSVKKAGGSKAPFPSNRDLTSRAMLSHFDTSSEKSLLSWAPESDKQTFLAKALDVHNRN